MKIELYGIETATTEKVRREFWRKIFSDFPERKATDFQLSCIPQDSRNSTVESTPFIRVYSSEVSNFTWVREILISVGLLGAGIKTHTECFLLQSCA